jgi:hypothetical protein
MASQVSVAIERDEAIARINTVLERLAVEQGQEYAPLPTQGREQTIVVKNQLVHIADALERLLSVPIVEALEADADRDTEDSAPDSTDTKPRKKGK